MDSEYRQSLMRAGGTKPKLLIAISSGSQTVRFVADTDNALVDGNTYKALSMSEIVVSLRSGELPSARLRIDRHPDIDSFLSATDGANAQIGFSRYADGVRHEAHLASVSRIRVENESISLEIGSPHDLNRPVVSVNVEPHNVPGLF